VASAKKAGVGFGFYYSVVSNLFLNVCGGVVQPGAGAGQRVVTQAQYDAIVLGHLRELWGNYGPLAELWFDGGYGATLGANLTQLIAELQPHAVAFGGNAAPSPIAWEFESTQAAGCGDRASATAGGKQVSISFNTN
jgi:hypothetical protein